MNATVTVTLQDLCLRHELPKGTANELITYLTVKTLVGKEKAWELSPSFKLDRLLHRVLLDTELRTSVEELVGPIHHSEASTRLPEEEKAKRRLATLEAISRYGWEPSLALWQEPGTLLHSITCKPTVDLETLERWNTYTAAASGAGSGSPLSSDASALPQENPAAPRPGAKRPRRASPEQLRREVVARVKSLTGSLVLVRLKGSTATILELKCALSDIIDMPTDEMRLFSSGRQLEDSRTLADYNLGNEPTIYLVRTLRGC